MEDITGKWRHKDCVLMTAAPVTLCHKCINVSKNLVALGKRLNQKSHHKHLCNLPDTIKASIFQLRCTKKSLLLAKKRAINTIKKLKNEIRFFSSKT